MTAKLVRILGVSVRNMSVPEAIETFNTFVERPDRRTHAVSIVNANTLNLAYESSAYRVALNDSDLILGDGTGIRMAARQRGVEMKANLVGTDLIPAYFTATANMMRRMYLLGATDEAVNKAAQYCETHYPGWTVVGKHNGYVGDAILEQTIERINSCKPDVLLVAMGNPSQELWIHANKDKLQVPICVGVGGLFDHWAGTLHRAPKWVRRLGIEWVQILLQQPHKWRRYLVGNLAFLVRIRKQLASDSDSRLNQANDGK